MIKGYRQRQIQYNKGEKQRETKKDKILEIETKLNKESVGRDKAHYVDMETPPTGLDSLKCLTSYVESESKVECRPKTKLKWVGAKFI